MKLITLIRLTAFIFIATLLFTPSISWATGTCIQDVWTAHGNSQGLTCTAKDVSLSEVRNLCIVVTPGSPGDGDSDGCLDENKCIDGEPFMLRGDFYMTLGAQARYDIGFYGSSTGATVTNKNTALSGACSGNTITEANAPATFINLDDPSQPGDTCGDIDDPHNPQIVTLTMPVKCTGGADGKVVLGWNTSWRQPGSNEVCDSTVETDAATFDAYPGSPSKCNGGNITLDIFRETAMIEVTKTASPTTVAETGGSVVYMVSVKNKATVATVTLTSLLDDVYGDTTKVQGDITDTTCALVTINPGDTYTCSFTVMMPAGNFGDSVTDIVKACGDDSFNNPTTCDDDDATVTYTNVMTAPSMTKTPVIKWTKVGVEYTVVVTNNSTVDSLTIKTMTDDKFGDILAAHVAGGGFGEVVSTDCAVDGTIPPNDGVQNNTYTCKFLGVVETTGVHTNKVSVGTKDSDGDDYAIDGSASVNVPAPSVL